MAASSPRRRGRAHVDEDWNMEFWGRDELALERRAQRWAEMQAACLVLGTTKDTRQGADKA